MGADVFPETAWSLVLAAADKGEPDRAHSAFLELCGNYRQPIFRWMCLVGLSPADAEDATHDFLWRWLKRGNPLLGFQRRERRFREFLSACLQRYLNDTRDRARTQKRGAGAPHGPLEEDAAADAGALPGLLLDLELARFIDDEVRSELQKSWTDRVGAQAFAAVLRLALDGENDVPQVEVARRLGCLLNTLKGWVLRLRREHFERFRVKVALLSPLLEAEGEIVYLLALLKVHAGSQSLPQPGRTFPVNAGKGLQESPEDRAWPKNHQNQSTS